MKKQSKAEALILERVLDLLDEGSVTHLMRQDEHFASYIVDLYSSLQAMSLNLRDVA